MAMKIRHEVVLFKDILDRELGRRTRRPRTADSGLARLVGIEGVADQVVAQRHVAR